MDQLGLTAQGDAITICDDQLVSSEVGVLDIIEGEGAGGGPGDVDSLLLPLVVERSPARDHCIHG